eukprot:scaffold7446_cov84-Phaeocystis_antarctica.AAC.1
MGAIRESHSRRHSFRDKRRRVCPAPQLTSGVGCQFWGHLPAQKDRLGSGADGCGEVNAYAGASPVPTSSREADITG